MELRNAIVRENCGFTRYTNPSEAFTMALILSVGVVGVVSRTYNEKEVKNNIKKLHFIIN